jgi:hypothetical protein
MITFEASSQTRFVGDLPEESSRFNQTSLAYGCDILRTGGGIGLEARLTSGQEDMCRRLSVNAGRQWNHEHCISALVAISHV